MPIYEYRCGDCAHQLEVMQKLAEEPLTDCPECGASSLKKLISAVGFRLKGSGWYETDFKTGDRKRNLVENGEKSSSESKSEDKPATKTESKTDSTTASGSSNKTEAKSATSDTKQTKATSSSPPSTG